MNQPLELFPGLIILALFLLAIENLLSNRFYNRPASRQRLPGANKPPENFADDGRSPNQPDDGLRLALVRAGTVSPSSPYGLFLITVWTTHGVEHNHPRGTCILILVWS